MKLFQVLLLSILFLNNSIAKECEKILDLDNILNQFDSLCHHTSDIKVNRFNKNDGITYLKKVLPKFKSFLDQYNQTLTNNKIDQTKQHCDVVSGLLKSFLNQHGINTSFHNSKTHISLKINFGDGNVIIDPTHLQFIKESKVENVKSDESTFLLKDKKSLIQFIKKQILNKNLSEKKLNDPNFYKLLDEMNKDKKIDKEEEFMIAEEIRFFMEVNYNLSCKESLKKSLYSINDLNKQCKFEQIDETNALVVNATKTCKKVNRIHLK